MERLFYLLAYDISNDRRRIKIAKICESLADRVQGSVFEAYLTTKELEKMVKKANRHMDMETDSLRVYKLCETCREKVIVVGKGKITEAPGLKII